MSEWIADTDYLENLIVGAAFLGSGGGALVLGQLGCAGAYRPLNEGLFE